MNGIRKYSSELIWNYISLIIMALSGLMMNTTVASFYDSAVVGVFNVAYAWFIVLSQMAVWGIHMAVLKYVPELNDADDKGSVLMTSLMLSFCTSLIVTIIVEGVLVCLPLLAWRRSLAIASSALVFLSLNRVLLNYLNAIRDMVVYAVFLSFRYGVDALVILGLAVAQIDPDCLLLAFPAVELVLFVMMVVYIAVRHHPHGRIERRRAVDIIWFGTKILPSYMVLEMNAKMDVICLGFLIHDQGQIGVYSFAVLFSEGFYMLYVTVRKFINPSLSEKASQGVLEEYIDRLNQIIHRHLAVISMAGYIMLLAGYWVICLIFNKGEYRIGIIYIAIICLAVVINGKSVLFGDLLAQTGHPLDESLLNMLTVLSNIVLNVILIVLLGTTGAAIATAVSYFIFSIVMRYQIKRRIGLIL